MWGLYHTINSLCGISHHALGLTKQLVEAGVAVRLVLLLFERALVELLEAEGTDKVLRVELTAHRGDAAAGDGALAAGAQGTTALMVVRLTEGQALVVEEAAINEGCVALPADEALWMPQCVQG